LIDELPLSDQEKLVAIMEAGCDEVSDIDDLINLTFNLDCYDIMPGINDEAADLMLQGLQPGVNLLHIRLLARLNDENGNGAVTLGGFP